MNRDKKNRDKKNNGYLIAVCHEAEGPYICGAEHIEADQEAWVYENDADAARAAERDGVRLLYGMPYVADGVYVDTPENRLILRDYSKVIAKIVREKLSH